MKVLNLRKVSGLILLMLIFTGWQVWGQTLSIRGTVKEETGSTLPGVNVYLLGTLTGTITDQNGNYSIDAPGNGTLVFSFIGFKSKTVPINNQRVIDIALEQDMMNLDEVMVVGYGVQKKSDITGAITSVDAGKLRDVAASSISKAIQGKAAGVEIQNLSTRPGGNTQIRIRGNRSLTASNDPLIVVDGIPFSGSLNDISYDDIASIEILKDASATVIYGSRGANGVIIITTKRGKEGALKVSYNGYQGVTTVARRYDVFSAEEFVKLRTAAGYTNYLPNEKESMLLGRETNWQDLIYQDGLTANHELTLSGGTRSTQYAFSGGYFSETGVLPDMDYTRYNMRVAIDQAIGKRIKIGFTSMNSYAITNGQSANPMWALVSLTPLSIPYNLDGTLNEQPMYDTDDTYSPLTLRDHSRWGERNRRLASFTTLYGEVQLLKGLKYRLNLGLDLNENKYNNFYGSNTIFRSGLQNQAQVSHNDNLGYVAENLLTYENIFAGDHRLNVTGMYSVQQSETTSSRIDATNIPVDYIQYNNLALAEVVNAPSNGNFYSKWGLMSYMARVNYAYKDKYMLTLTGRADGSSRLAPGNKWHAYPAVAAGWNITSEPFMEPVTVISYLKLRAGYGQTSNTSINPYSTLGGLSNSLYSFGDEGVKGYYVSTLPNANLGWEYTTTTNIGLEYGFFDGRLYGSVDAYLQNTHDLLLGKQLPPSQGVPGSYLENIGKTRNKGLEIVANGVIVRPKTKDGFSWEVSANLFLNRETIVALQDTSITQDIGNGWFVGYPSSAIYDYVKIGIWQLGEEDSAAVYSRKPGDIHLLDFAGGGENGDEPDGKITDADRRVIGSAQPDFQGGFSTSLRWKGFDFSLVGYYRVGGTIVSTLHMPSDYVNRLDGRRNGIDVDYWTTTNPTNDMPLPNYAIDASRTSVLGYFDGTFLKIRSINLGYNLDKKLTKWISPDAVVRIYGTCTDPFLLFCPYVEAGGVDPEPNTFGATTISGGEGVPARALKIGLNTPPTRKFIFGLNVTF